MKPEIYFNQLVMEASDTQLSIPILNNLVNLNKGQLHYLFSQIYYFVDFFPGLLGLLLWKANDKRIRFTIIDNLIDECGGAEKINSWDYSEMHSRLLKAFVMGLGKANTRIAEKSSGTELLINQFSKLFIKATPITALGAMASMETLSTQWFNLVYKQLQERNEFSQESLYFFELHTRLDEEHGNILKEILLPLLVDQNDFGLLKSGVMTTTTLWESFYTTISEEISEYSLT